MCSTDVHSEETCCDTYMQIDSKRNLFVCVQCGECRDYENVTASTLGFERTMNFNNFSYKRSNHLQDWLNSFQAKESKQIPRAVLDKVRAHLKDVNPDDMTVGHVRGALKRMSMREYYDNVVLIMCILTRRDPPRLDHATESKIKFMFLQIQAPFKRHCPATRKNFLSYSYCLYKFFELLDMPEYMRYFSLLKGRDKLLKQDRIFENICSDLGWRFIPSV